MQLLLHACTLIRNSGQSTSHLSRQYLTYVRLYLASVEYFLPSNLANHLSTCRQLRLKLPSNFTRLFLVRGLCIELTDSMWGSYRSGKTGKSHGI